MPRIPMIFAGLLACGLVVGCSDDDCATSNNNTGADGGVRECNIPNTMCGTGEYNAYGLCVDNETEIEITGGTFEMGTAAATEFPQHNITLSDYVIDKYEVTNLQYEACVAAGCCDPPTYDGSYSAREPYFGNTSYNNYPVVFVTWEMARQYCEGMGKRLPTEAEWEYAARGSDGRSYPWGSNGPSTNHANYDEARDGDTEEVGSFPDGASAFGLEDMGGNVWEWVNDWYDPLYYTISPAMDPTGPEDGVIKVARGGSFASTAASLFSWYRGSYIATESFSNLGFRCAR